MEPTNNEASIQLPAPVEHLPDGAQDPNKAPKGPETSSNSEGASQAMPAPMPINIPLPTPPSMPQSHTQASSTTSKSQSNPAQAADDTDLIEKEWVTKAKEIVEQTREDPYKQSEELTVFKADYMKKRYNRAIKLK